MQFVDTDLSAWESQQARMHEALRRDEFALYAQPIVVLDRPSEWPMAEVLIRLRQEEKALLPPGEFLPAFELFGMMPQLDAWVLRHVIQQHLAGFGARRCSINVSGQTLEYSGFLRLFGELAKSHAVPAGAVLFEIEETDIIARPQAAAQFAAAVRALGGGIVVDGFGRRSLSMAPLKGLQPDYVKVDGSITRRVAYDESCVLKVNSILRLAKALDIGVIAECVETPEAAARLNHSGVGFAQGYGICRPQPIEELVMQEQLAAA
jgi:EAL domain-containing protein (putative c-di-GMP-specific phosphodiesterase class I)